MTTQLTATLAREAQVGERVLIHLSDRHAEGEWPAMLAEARAVFPATNLPTHWRVGGA